MTVSPTAGSAGILYWFQVCSDAVMLQNVRFAFAPRPSLHSPPGLQCKLQLPSR